MRFSFCLFVHLNELTWTNKMTVQFDDTPWKRYISLHKADRPWLAKVVTEHERGYQHVVLRTISHFWVYKGQKNSLIWFLEFFAERQFFRFSFHSKENFWVSLRYLVIMFKYSFVHLIMIFVHFTMLCRKKNWKNVEQVRRKSEQMWLFKNENCEDSRTSQTFQKYLRVWIIEITLRNPKSFMKLSQKTFFVVEIQRVI